MGGRKERQIGNGDSNRTDRVKHSENHEVQKYRSDMGRKLFGARDNAVEDASREARIKRSQKEFKETEELAEERRRIYEGRQHTLEHHILHWEITEQDLRYVARKEQIIESYTTESGNRVTIAILDFNHRGKMLA